MKLPGVVRQLGVIYTAVSDDVIRFSVGGPHHHQTSDLSAGIGGDSDGGVFDRWEDSLRILDKFLDKVSVKPE